MLSSRDTGAGTAQRLCDNEGEGRELTGCCQCERERESCSNLASRVGFEVQQDMHGVRVCMNSRATDWAHMLVKAQKVPYSQIRSRSGRLKGAWQVAGP